MSLNRFIAGLVACLACFLIANAQDLTDQQRQIRAAVDGGDATTALTSLDNLRRTRSDVFTRNNYDYLLARLAERRGDTSTALVNYQAVVKRESVLQPYALWHLAQFARATGDLVLERERLRQLLKAAPGSLLHDAATMRLARSFLESLDYIEAVATVKPLAESKNITLARQALALMGEVLLRGKNAGDEAAQSRLGAERAEAAAIFNRLIKQMPDPSRPDDFALAAVRGLDMLDEISQSRSALSETDHLQRANIYQFNRDFAGARFHYLAVVEKYPQSSTVPNALFQVGRGLYQQGTYAEAIKYLQRVESEYAESLSSQDAVALKAAAYLRLKRYDDAITAYRQFIDRYPNAPNPERAWLNLIDALRDAGRDDQALDWIKQTRAAFKDQPADALALFAQAKIHLARQQWTLAVSDLEELQKANDLGGTRVPGGTVNAEVAFLRAFAIEQLGRTEDAVTAYLAIPEGRNEYYGFLANQRLQALAAATKSQPTVSARLASLQAEAKRTGEGTQSETARRALQSSLRLVGQSQLHNQLLEQLRQSYAALPAYRLPSFKLLALGRQELRPTSPNPGEPETTTAADELLFLGLYDEGTPEFVAARATASKAAGGAPQALGDLDYTIAIYSLRGDLPNPAVRFAESVWRAVPSDYVIDLAPREMIELLYPAPHRNALLKEASPRSVDSRFVLSIARQESRFRADAKSVAAARGLMQFISATADDVAKQLGRRDFRQDDLYDPTIAIQFGSQYLQSLFKQFPAMPEAVAASYNGGADNMARWIARSHVNDPGRYVAEIGFAQTKDYVFRVMTNYWIYQQLYSDQLQKL